MMDLLVRLKASLASSILLVTAVSFAVASNPIPLQNCERIIRSECQSAGYNYTAPFPNIDGKPFQEVKGDALVKYLGALNACSKYSAAILCSLYFPKCVNHLARPVLPCQNVCNDFVQSCATRLDLAAMRGLFSGLCSLLPLYDGHPDTCFIPNGFDVDKGKTGVDISSCHKVALSKCQDDLHYNFTFLSNDTQTLSNVHLLTPIIASKCSPDIEKFTCFTRVPPCSVNSTMATFAIPCKSMCLKINQNCSKEFNNYHIPKTDCDFVYPDSPSSTGMCNLTKWPAPWPRTQTTVPPPHTKKPSECRYCKKVEVPACSKAGYLHTFNFKDINKEPYQKAASRTLEKVMKLLQCSPYAQTILCSMYVPKCDMAKCSDKPVLPCRRVCHEFARSCENELRIAALHGLFVGLCDLLPWNDTKATPCFVPPDFKQTSQAYQRQVCFPISNEHNSCSKDFSYNSTFLSASDQIQVKMHALQPIIDSKCSSRAEQLICFTRIPPCSRKGDLSVALPCRWLCNEVISKCKDVFQKLGFPVIDCDMLLPDADGDDDGMCRTNRFPIPYRHFNHHKRGPPVNGHGPNAGLIAGLAILVLVLIVAVSVAVIYYRKRKKNSPFEPKVLHNVDLKDSY